MGRYFQKLKQINKYIYILLILLYNIFDISFLIASDGTVYEGTGWLIIGAHTYGYNTNGTGIAFIGDYTGILNFEAFAKCLMYKMYICL